VKLNRRYAAVAAVAIVAAAAWVAWMPARSPVAPSASTVKPTVASPRHAPAANAVARGQESAPAHAPATVPPPDWPDYRTPLDEAVHRLRGWADDGNAKAGMYLSSMLSRCTPHALRESQAADERNRSDMAEDEKDGRFTAPQREGRRANIMRQIEDNASLRAACARVPPDLVAHWLDPLDRAARSGDVDAMREYARVAMNEYTHTAAVVGDIDEVITRRDKARTYLDEALRRGDSTALLDLADAYSESATTNIYAADAAHAHAYAYAATLADLHDLPEYDRRQLGSLLDESARALDATALARSEADGRRIYEQCCARH